MTFYILIVLVKLFHLNYNGGNNDFVYTAYYIITTNISIKI